MSDIKLYNDDCFNIFPQIEDKSVDMICCDLPYGTTKNKWDVLLPLDELWKEYERIIKPNGAIVMFSQMPFTAILAVSNLAMFKYELIWEKDNGTGFLNANYAPLKNHENILVFSKGATSYTKNTMPMTYNPQKTKGTPYFSKSRRRLYSSNYDSKHIHPVDTDNKGDRFPLTIIKFNRDKEKFHPTQKPVALLEYLIKTYTNEGMLVLDNCMGSGTCGVACKKLNRNFIGIEKEKEYFDIAEKRINDTIVELTLFSGEISSKKFIQGKLVKDDTYWDLFDEIYTEVIKDYKEGCMNKHFVDAILHTLRKFSSHDEEFWTKDKKKNLKTLIKNAKVIVSLRQYESNVIANNLQNGQTKGTKAITIRS